MAGVKRMKNKVIRFVDILTVIILMIGLQSWIIFVKENFIYLQNYSWDSCILCYSVCGMLDMIRRSSYEYIYHGTVFVVYFASFYVITVKLIDLWKKELIHRVYRWFIVINICFVVFKTLEFLIHLDREFGI